MIFVRYIEYLRTLHLHGGYYDCVNLLNVPWLMTVVGRTLFLSFVIQKICIYRYMYLFINLSLSAFYISINPAMTKQLFLFPCGRPHEELFKDGRFGHLIVVLVSCLVIRRLRMIVRRSGKRLKSGFESCGFRASIDTVVMI